MQMCIRDSGKPGLFCVSCIKENAQYYWDNPDKLPCSERLKCHVFYVVIGHNHSMTRTYSNIKVFGRPIEGVFFPHKTHYGDGNQPRYPCAKVETHISHIPSCAATSACSSLRLGRRFAEDISCVSQDDEPVSYTHLDVYKRQLPLHPDANDLSSAGYLSTT